jgi:hypothetical protein
MLMVLRTKVHSRFEKLPAKPDILMAFLEEIEIGTLEREERLREGQERGQVDKKLDPDIAAAILVNAIESAANLSLRDPKFDQKKVPTC